MPSFKRTLLPALLAFLMAPAMASQCQPMSLVAAQQTPLIFLGTIEARQATTVAPDPKFPAILDAPQYLVRVRVTERLRGDLPAQVELLCPQDDTRCRVGSEPLLIALPTPWIDGARPRMLCRFAEARTEGALVESLRAARAKR